jgi:hypothetical protein
MLLYAYFKKAQVVLPVSFYEYKIDQLVRKKSFIIELAA